jgi:hypothetical protein
MKTFLLTSGVVGREVGLDVAVSTLLSFQCQTLHKGYFRKYSQKQSSKIILNVYFSVCLGCYSKILGGLNKIHLFLTVLSAGMSKIKVLMEDSVLVEGLSSKPNCFAKFASSNTITFWRGRSGEDFSV